LSSAALFRRSFRDACGLFATGVAVLTTRASSGEAHGITVNSFCSLSLDPPLVMVAIDKDCTFLNHFETCAFFAVNILREVQRDLSIRFAQHPGDRFHGIAYRDTASGAPWIDRALALLDCKTTQVLDMGDHRLLIGEVLEVAVEEGRPLIFFRSGYAKLS
jgi:flavin reductase (DIM6/NTAB) family NADH-FMN oxidoreductase RutF